jgi:hypothetical protein
MTDPGSPSPAQQRQLLDIAVAAIRYGLTHKAVMPVPLENYSDNEDPLLLEQRATFVTLKINHDLRGCIGTLSAHQPLIIDVAHNAYQAAFRDPRFEPLQSDEFEQLHISISILSPPAIMHVTSEQDLINQLRPGTDGLIIEDGHHRATFLPSVWQQLPDPVVFLQHLKNKAGLATDYWSDTLTVERYNSIKFGEAVTQLLK